MRFWAYGPLPVNLDDLGSFWNELDSWAEFDGLEAWELRRAIGCYVFAMQRGKKLIPFYVGKTNAKTGFHGEVFTPHKLKHYRSSIAAKPTHKPKMLLFPLITATEKLSRAHTSHRGVIEWMERTLIGMALAKNDQLMNARDTKLLRTCIVDGVFGREGHGHQYDAAMAARRALTDLID